MQVEAHVKEWLFWLEARMYLCHDQRATAILRARYDAKHALTMHFNKGYLN